MTPNDIPYYETFQGKSQEKRKVICSKKRTMSYAQYTLQQAGLRQRLLGHFMIAVEAGNGRVAYFWPVLRRWQWEGEKKRRRSTSPEDLVEAVGA